MFTEHQRLQRAIFDRQHHDNQYSWEGLEKYHGVPIHKLRQASHIWELRRPESQPEIPVDTHIRLPSVGRPCVVTSEHESVITDAIRYYVDKTPLSQSVE